MVIASNSLLGVIVGLIGWNKFVGFDRSDDALLSPDSLVSVDTIPVISPIVANPIEPIKGDVPSTTPLYVSTSPVGATIYLDGKKVGKSPIEGKEVSRGKHTVKLVLEGYEQFSKQYTFGDKPIVISENLVAVRTSVPEEPSKPTSTPLYISTSPSGAVVYLDGMQLGKSPVEGKEVFRGNHTIKLVLDGYEPLTKQYTFGDKPIVINENLVAEEPSKSAPTVVSTTGSINGHEWVDLGLSVKWATMNVGATPSSAYGDYFAWGEVHPKSEYTGKNSRTSEKSMGNISGNSQYDSARYHWGGSWRLPTKKELEELKDKCRWTWTKESGHNGYLVVGPNGNSIFLPAAGLYGGDTTGKVGTHGNYWSGSPNERNAHFAYGLYFIDDFRHVVSSDSRHFGQSVRPVSD